MESSNNRACSPESVLALANNSAKISDQKNHVFPMDSEDFKTLLEVFRTLLYWSIEAEDAKNKK